MATRYFRFRVDGQLYGLIRRRDGATGIPVLLSRVENGEWVDDASIYRYWIDPGYTDLVEVDAADASLAAAASGVKLTARSARTAPRRGRRPVTTWDELPTLARRSFEEYLRRFTAANPASVPRRVGDPVRVDGAAAWSVAFEDSATARTT